MSSSSQSPRRSPQVQQKQKPHKVFVTNLDIEVEPQALETELFEKFSKFGKLDSVVVKKSYNNKYSFAFIEYREGEDATEAVEELNGIAINGKKIKVELQDNTRRRRGADESKPVRSETCYVCGKTGHFAKSCRQNREKAQAEVVRRDRSRSRSRSAEQKKRKKSSKKRRHRSESSESRSPRRKQKKEKERSRKQKKSSRHKRDRRRSSSSA